MQEMNWHELSIIAVYSNALLVDMDLSDCESEAGKILSQIDWREPDADRPDTVPMDAIFAQLGDLPPDRRCAVGQLARQLMDERRFSPTFWREVGLKPGITITFVSDILLRVREVRWSAARSRVELLASHVERFVNEGKLRQARQSL